MIILRGPTTITQAPLAPSLPAPESPRPPIYPDKSPKYPLRGQRTEYQQMGIVTSSDEDPKILPLYGKPVAGRSDRWNYYTSSDNNSGTLWKIPVKIEGKDCQENIGCKEIYEGDSVEIPVYKKEFKATVYKYDTPQYDPLQV